MRNWTHSVALLLVLGVAQLQGQEWARPVIPAGVLFNLETGWISSGATCPARTHQWTLQSDLSSHTDEGSGGVSLDEKGGAALPTHLGAGNGYRGAGSDGMDTNSTSETLVPNLAEEWTFCTAGDFDGAAIDDDVWGVSTTSTPTIVINASAANGIQLLITDNTSGVLDVDGGSISSSTFTMFCVAISGNDAAGTEIWQDGSYQTVNTNTDTWDDNLPTLAEIHAADINSAATEGWDGDWLFFAVWDGDKLTDDEIDACCSDVFQSVTTATLTCN